MRRAAFLTLLVLGGLALGGCGVDRMQSALHPESEEARKIARLWWVMLTVYGGVFLATMGLLAVALRRGSGGPPGGGTKFVVVAGMVAPAIILVGMLVYALVVSVSLRFPETELTVRVTGHQWWWEVEYPELGIVTANEIHVPAGRAVRLELTSADVIHSFWVPNLHGKMDLIPEKVNALWLRADRPGIYRGQCAEFCGTQHALMAFEVIALEAGVFEEWAAERRGDDTRPQAGDHVAAGRAVFETAGCINCHSVRGVGGTEGIGPDLTHLASRRKLGAASVPNNRTHLSGWVKNPQGIKPGNLMPPTKLAPEELNALLDYLEALR